MLDKLIVELDKIVKTLGTIPQSKRPHPDRDIPPSTLSVQQRKHVIGLMRVNHCGEICAQGLYQGQALMARNKLNQEAFNQAAFEETEHLAWTWQRIKELGGRTSWLNPMFYAGSLFLGIAAGMLGDTWNLGFLEETERQVEAHLKQHLHQLPKQDEKSKAILKQMQIDETNHATMAHEFGAKDLPQMLRLFMQISSKIMTTTTYYL